MLFGDEYGNYRGQKEKQPSHSNSGSLSHKPNVSSPRAGFGFGFGTYSASSELASTASILDEVKQEMTDLQRPPDPSVPASLICVVCGASANGYNFDAVTCESCKAFFRRNAFRSVVSRNYIITPRQYILCSI
jgi:hypothetical protein